MAIKLVKVGVAAVPGVIEIAEDVLDVEPTYIHATRILEFGAGLLGSLMVPEDSPWADPLEALMLASEPLAIKSIYGLMTEAVEGAPTVTKEAIELKLKQAGQVIPPVRPEEVAIEF